MSFWGHPLCTEAWGAGWGGAAGAFFSRDRWPSPLLLPPAVMAVRRPRAVWHLMAGPRLVVLDRRGKLRLLEEGP